MLVVLFPGSPVYPAKSDLSHCLKSVQYLTNFHVIARSEATWQSAFPKNIAITVLFRIGERIATPVCALARNDVDVMMVHTEQPDKSEFDCQ